MKALVCLFLLFPFFINAQIIEDNFTNADLSTNPTWVSSNSVDGSFAFVVDGGRLRSQINAGGAGTRQAWISTSIAGLEVTTDPIIWEFKAELDFTSTASNNYANVYLFSDTEDLTASLNGYFVRVQDEITLYKQENSGAITPLISSSFGGYLNTEQQIKVERLIDGTWQLFINDILQGSIQDNTWTNAQYFGAQIRYTANSRRNSFFFDDFRITQIPDLLPPEIISVGAITENSLIIIFNEPLLSSSITTLAQYEVSGGIGNPNEVQLGEFPNESQLTFANALTFGSDYILSLSGVSDVSGNAITSPINYPFTFADNLPPKLTKIEVISPNAILAYFNETLDAPTANNQNNYLELDNGSIPQTASYNATSQRVLLVFADNFEENQTLTLQVANVEDIQGNAISPPNTLNFEYDTRNPRVETDGVMAISANELEIQFSEPVQEVSALTLNHYEVTPSVGFPNSVTFLSPDKVKATFAQNFQPNLPYNLKVTDIADLVGNRLTTNNRSFIYDIYPPQIVSQKVIANNKILLEFSEPLRESSAGNINNFEIDGIIANEAKLLAGNKNTIELSFSTLPQATFDLEVSNVTDASGNAMENTTLVLDNTNPKLVQVLPRSTTELKVHFSRDMETTSVENTAAYQGVGMVESAVVGTELWEVILTLSNPLNFNQSYELITKNVSDIGGNSITEQSVHFQLKRRIINAQLINPQLIELTFDVPVEGKPPPEKFTIAPSINPISVSIDTENGAVVRLFFEAELPANQELTLTVQSILLADGTRSIEETIVLGLDKKPPSLQNAVILNSQRVMLIFNEPLEETTATALNHYQLSDLIPITVEFDNEFPNQIILVFDIAFDFLQTYELVIKNLTDASGNPIENLNLTLKRATSPPASSLIITEIMANPSENTPLPNAEYLELYNQSDEIQALQGVIVQDATGRTQLDFFELPPQSYLILCNADEVENFTPYGEVLGVENWRSLNNAGELLTLISPAGETIFEVAYDDDWYGEEEKADGGWSLEMINLNQPACFTVGENWTASNDEKGGTPGQQNSTESSFSTEETPRLATWQLLDDKTITLTFAQQMDSLSLQNTSAYQLTPNQITQVREATPFVVSLSLANNLALGETYELSLQGLLACTGQALDTTFQIILGKTPQAGELVFNEIMADPEPSIGLPEVEYLELLNTTTNYLQLEGLILKDATKETRLPNFLVAPKATILLCSRAATDSLVAFNAIGISGFPSLNNSGETLSLEDALGKVIDSFTYANRLFPEEKRAGGWSLERMLTQCEEPIWAASNHPDGGTPNQPNSLVTDGLSPQLLSFTLANESSVTLSFSEKVALTTESVGGVNVEGINRVDETTWQLLLSNELPVGKQTELTLNISDCFGNVLDTTLSIILGRKPEIGEVLLNEIMADPTPAVGLPEAEYLELFNPTEDYLSLEAITLSDATTSTILPNLLIAPNRFVVFTSTTHATLLSNYNAVGLSGFPSLNNTGERIALTDSSGRIIDEVTYSTDELSTEKKEGGWSLERKINLCSGLVWAFSSHPDGGTPNAKNTALQQEPQPAQLQTVSFINAQQLALTFTQKIELTENQLSVSLASLQTTDSLQWIVELQQQIEVGRAKEIQLSTQNCIGQSLDTTFQIINGRIPLQGEILFNEIMADPSPAVGLPEVEYIELLNTTNNYLKLQGIFLQDATTKTQLPTLTVAPNAFVLLTSTGDVNALASFEAVGISAFPSLNNSGETLALLDSVGNTIDEITYTNTWLPEEKRVGGWSLERVESNCNPSFWIGSENPIGGTPNALNAEYTDVTPPQLLATYVENDTDLLFRFSERVNSLAVTGVTLDSIFEETQTTFRLTIREQLKAGKTEIRLQLADCFGNTTDTTLSLFKGRTPEKGELIFNEIMTDLEPSIGLPIAEYLELYNRSDAYLSLENLLLSDATTQAVLPNRVIPPKAYVLLSSNTSAEVLAQFQALGIANFPNLNNAGETLTLQDSEGNTIDEITYTDDWHEEGKNEGGWSLERIENSCNLSFWVSSNHPSGGTPNVPNSSFTKTEKPSIVAWTLQSDSLIEIIFSEVVKTLDFSELTVDSLFSENQIVWQVNLANPLSEGVNTVSVSFEDCFGNRADTTLQVIEARMPEIGEVLINEVMADPSPSVGLPEAEYLELFNPTDDYLQLEGIQLSDATAGVPLPNLILAPKSFVVLSTTTAAADLSPFQAVGIANFPSLNNSGETLTLSDSLGNIIHQVTYSEDFFPPEKQEGGWSLERQENSCGEFWAASNHSGGGTPNATNSFHVDETPPSLLASNVRLGNLLSLHFSEAVQLEISNLKLDPATVESIEQIGIAAWEVRLTAELPNGITVLQIQAADCFGNAMDTTVQLINARPPQLGEVFFNEIMADPSPAVGLPEEEYVEFYNPTESYLQLENLILSDATTSTVLPELIIAPKNFVLLASTSAAEALSAFGAIGISSFPSLNNTGEILTLSDSLENIIDVVNYTDDWFSTDKVGGGWSLERQIGANACANQVWQPSQHPSGGTPKAENSVNIVENDNLPPAFQSVIALARDTIQLQFSEAITFSSAQFANYRFQPTLEVIEILQTLQNPRRVKLVLADTLQFGKTYSVEVNNMQDCAGNTMGQPQELFFQRPQQASKGDILISEILFNPLMGGTDFLELYNAADYAINLKQWKVADGRGETLTSVETVSDRDFIFPPKSFLVLTEDAARLKSLYPIIPDSTLWEMPLPSFPDREGVAVLLNALGDEMDRFAYEESMHFSLLDNEEGVSLERVSYDVSAAVSDNWKSAAGTSGYATPGLKNSQSVGEGGIALTSDCFNAQPELFTPDSDGIDDFTRIEYGCDANDAVVNILIFDVAGREIRRLVQNETLGQRAFFLWDGTDQQGRRVRTGNYLFWIEVFDIEGNVKQLKKRVAVGSRF